VYGMGPGTAKGIVFLSVEDETGIANAAVMPDVFDANRLLIISNRWLLVEGPIQNVDKLIHVRAKRIVPLGFSDASIPSHDFHRTPRANRDGPSYFRSSASSFGSYS
jgi:error-prone DNA polymerase